MRRKRKKVQVQKYKEYKKMQSATIENLLNNKMLYLCDVCGDMNMRAFYINKFLYFYRNNNFDFI